MPNFRTACKLFLRINVVVDLTFSLLLSDADGMGVLGSLSDVLLREGRSGNFFDVSNVLLRVRDGVAPDKGGDDPRVWLVLLLAPVASLVSLLTTNVLVDLLRASGFGSASSSCFFRWSDSRLSLTR